MRFPISKKRWEELNDEQVEAILASESPMYDALARIHGQHMDHGYNAFNMEIKTFKKVEKTLEKLHFIINEKARGTLTEVFDEYIDDIEYEMCDGRKYDTATVMEWLYMLQAYRERAVKLDDMEE